MLRVLRKPNIHYQHWNFSEPNVGKESPNLMYLHYLLPSITLPDSSFLGVQATGSTRNRPPGDAQEGWPGAGVIVSGAAQVERWL